MNDMSLTRTQGLLPSLAAILDEDDVSRRILAFLLRNEAAMDTARGIAAWWVDCDEMAVQAALDRLLISGAVTAHPRASGVLYGLTRNAETRAWLRSRLSPPAAG